MSGSVYVYGRGFVRALNALLLCPFLLLASCTQPTVFPHYLTVADVINNVKCELYLAIWDTIRENAKSVWLDPWAAKFSIQLQVKRQTVGNGDLTLVAPYNVPVRLFTLVVGVRSTRAAKAGWPSISWPTRI